MTVCNTSSMENNITSLKKSPFSNSMEEYITEIMTICLSAVCIFGMIGNLLTFIVLTREKVSHSLTKMEKSVHIGLIGLAISDFMFCLLAFLYTQTSPTKTFRERSLLLYFHWLSGPCITYFIVTSTWLIVAMAAERYLAVCYPFKARKLISLRKTRIIVTTIFLICLGLTIPLGFEKIIQLSECDGLIAYEIVKHPAFTDSVISKRRLAWAVAFDFIPCLALVYFNVCLIWKIHDAKRIRKAMAPTFNRDILLTKRQELFSYNSNSSSLSNYSKYQTTSVQTAATRCSPIRNHAHESEKIEYRKTSRQSVTTTSNPVNNHIHESETVGVMPRTHSAIHQKRFTSARKRNNADNVLSSVTVTLVAVVVFFLILVSPSEILKFIYTKSVGTQTKTYDIIRNVTNLMQAINFSFNFVLYCAINKSFRSSLGAIACFFCQKGLSGFKLKSLERAYCHKIELSGSET